VTGKVLDCIKKKDFNNQLRVSCNLDSTTRLLYLSTFEKSNLQPYVSYNETDPDAEMKALLNIEKNFLVATKR
jgi:hypothetical protein